LSKNKNERRIFLTSKKSMDMLHGSLWDKIIFFSVPLALTGVLQQLFNAADIMVLGQFVGKNAIAAVGNNISLIGILINLFLGFSLGANVVIAQAIGARHQRNAKIAVHTSIVFAFLIGLAITILGEIFAEPVLELMGVPPEIEDMAENYLRVYLLGMPLMSLYNFAAAIFRSRGDTKMPLIALAVASVLNLIMNMIFVVNYRWGLTGVVFATVLANGVSASILVIALNRSLGFIHLRIKSLGIDGSILKEIVRIGLPAAIQGMVFSFANLVIQGAINSLGADVMAASAAAFTIEINVYCFLGAFGQAATTFVGQNYGAGKMLRCKRATWVAIGLNAIVTTVLTAIVLLFGKDILHMFQNDPTVIELGYIRLLYIVGPEIICIIMEGLSGALRGYGISLPPAMLALVGVCGVRITWVYTLFKENPTYDVLMATYPVSWLVTTVFIAIAYKYYIGRVKPWKA